MKLSGEDLLSITVLLVEDLLSLTVLFVTYNGIGSGGFVSLTVL